MGWATGICKAYRGGSSRDCKDCFTLWIVKFREKNYCFRFPAGGVEDETHHFIH